MLHIANIEGHLFSPSNSYLLLHREPHYIINTFLGILLCPRFTQHTLNLHSRTRNDEGKNRIRRSSLWKGSKLNFVCGSRFPGFLLQCFVRTLHFLCSWVSCKAILAHHCSGPSRVIHYSAMPTAPFLVFGRQSDMSSPVLLAARFYRKSVIFFLLSVHPLLSSLHLSIKAFWGTIQGCNKGLCVSLIITCEQNRSPYEFIQIYLAQGFVELSQQRFWLCSDKDKWAHAIHWSSCNN